MPHTEPAFVKHYDAIDYGAGGDGVTNDTASIVAAADAAHAAGGGVVFFPAGTYIAEGLPLYENVFYLGSNSGASIVKSPNPPTTSMFDAAAAVDFAGGGIAYLDLDGRVATSGVHGIDFSDVSNELNDFAIDHCHVHHFDHGYHGATRDRFIPITNNRFWYCTVGLYVRAEHPNFGINDIRNNTTGVGGTLIHAQFLGTKFNYNSYGVRALDGGSVSESQFVGCHFGYNSTAGASVSDYCVFDGCLFLANAIGAYTPNSGTISACHFENHTGVVISIGAGNGIVITGNTFNELSGTGSLIYVSATAQLNRMMNVSNNSFYVDDRSVIDSANGFVHSNISGNVVYSNGRTNGTAAYFIIPGVSGGYTFIGNTIWDEAATTSIALNSASSIRATIVGNRFRSVGAPSFGTTDADTRIAHNFGYKTENGGTASVADTGTITHGIAATPTQYLVTPTKADRIAAVTAASSTTITVSLTDAAGTAVEVAENVIWRAWV